ncbi:MAG: hypothetical protein ACTSQE_00345 [Candidatus Heimdallarchaeaceae archaeon]
MGNDNLDLEPPKGSIERIGKKGVQDIGTVGLIRTGIRSLDQKFGMELASKAGIPSGSVIVVSYPASSVIPILFVQRILLNWAQKSDYNRVFYVHSSKPYNLIERSYAAYNWNIEEYKDKSFFFENMYDMTSSTTTSIKLGRIEVKRRTYVKRIVEKILHVKETQKKNCFSVFDDLLWLKEDKLDDDHNALIIFLKELIKMFSEIGGVHFFLLPQNIINPVAEQIILNYAQGIFHFSRARVGSMLRDTFTISKLMGVAYISEVLDVTPSEEEGFKIESTSKI